MKEQGNAIKSLVIAVGILAAVGFLGYLYLSREAVVEESLLIVEAPDSGAVDGDLLRALQELRTIKLDTTIFENSVFRSFYDFGTQIAPQDKGRPNPFAPVSGPGVTSSAQTQTLSL